MKNLELLRENNIGVDKAVVTLGSNELYDEVLNDFYEENLRRVAKLVEFKNKNDLQNYSILVHAMKSEAEYLGMHNFSQLCALHQKKSQENDVEFIINNFDNFMRELQKLFDVMKKYLEK